VGKAEAANKLSMTTSKIGTSRSSQQNSIFSDITTFFTSVRTAIALLFLLAATSILGTLIPQDMPLDQLQQTVSPFYFRLVTILDLHRLYGSWWFTLLLVLLALNIMGCLLQRLRRIPEDWKGGSGKSSFNISFSDPRDVKELRKIMSSALKKLVRGAPRVVETSDGLILSWVNDRVQLLGFPFIHAAIILILIGGLIGSLYGFKGKVQIKEGEKASRFTVVPTGTVEQLPFEIAVDRFELTRYPSGLPKEYRSDVRILAHGKEILKDSIRVNHPLTFQGISLYQSDYRLTGVKEVQFSIVNQSGEASEATVAPDAAVQLQGTQYKIRLVSLNPGSTTTAAGVEINAQGPDGQVRAFKLFKNDPSPAKIDELQLRFIDYTPLYATGLQIGYDPGSAVVWTGCIILLLGFLLTLFTNHRTIEVVLRATGSGSVMEISGRSKRLRKEFRERTTKAVQDSLHISDNKVAPIT
jgi:cytochrome c biogenesis protein